MIVPPNVRKLIQLALEEDLGRGDVTASLLHSRKEVVAQIIAREPAIVSGTEIIDAIFDEARAMVVVEVFKKNGHWLDQDEVYVELRGFATDLIMLERTLLNFLQRTFGIATVAAKIKKQIAGSGVRVVDTRKTLPGWRYLDKLAVRDGGLENHRFGLDSGVLIKENHIMVAGSIANAIERLQVPHHLKVEVEVQNREQILEAITIAQVDALLLDNFSYEQLASVIPMIREKAAHVLIEISGGVTCDTFMKIVQLKPDLISMGQLTHSVRAADLSMLFDTTA